MLKRNSRRAVWREHPEIRHGGWKILPLPTGPDSPSWVAAMRRRLTAFYVGRDYSVQVYVNDTTWGEVDHLLVRPHDEKPVRSWSDFQALKNDLCGHDRIAIEVFPAERDLIDVANVYHLWVLPAGFELPFGLHMDCGGFPASKPVTKGTR